MIEIKTENFRTNNTIYSYVFVNSKEVGFIANSLETKTFQFFYEDNEKGDHRASPEFSSKKELAVWLSTTFG